MRELTEREKIRRCPFCKGEARTDSIYWGNEEEAWADDYSVVMCTKCGAMGPKCQTEEEAIEMWNRRA